MQLKQISRILVQFSPLSGNARSAREFIARVTSDPARASNPECTVETKVRVKSEPFIEIEYDNKNVERIASGNLSIQQILDIVQNRAEEMDTAAKLEKAGLQGQQLNSSWLRDFGGEKEIGQTAFIPRQQ